jgi:hypothetical protein
MGYDRTQDIVRATELKGTGNAHFSASRWSLALEDYKEALACLPQREKRQGTSNGKGKERAGVEDADAKEEEEEDGVEQVELAGEDKSVTELRAVLWANVGACHIKEVSFSLWLVLARYISSSLLSSSRMKERWNDAVNACNEGASRFVKQYLLSPSHAESTLNRCRWPQRWPTLQTTPKPCIGAHSPTRSSVHGPACPLHSKVCVVSFLWNGPC